MYPVGLLFGLSFDTASEVALLAILAIAYAVWKLGGVEGKWAGSGGGAL